MKSYAVQMSDTVMERTPQLNDQWSYDYGVVFKGMEQVWRRTKERKYFDFIKRNMDEFIRPDGSIAGYENKYNIDYLNNGKALLFLYRETGEEKYRITARLLRAQLDTHPRTSEGGFWHKAIYPHQMWLDGLYMGAPFYAEYSLLMGGEDNLKDAARQFILMEKHARDEQSGLLHHAWDEAKEQRWADPKTGKSPHIWGRAMGWYAMALVDVLELFPEQQEQRKELIGIWKRLEAAITAYQDQETELWYQIVDQQERVGNYPEASVSAMFVYALLKSSRLGFGTAAGKEAAQRGYQGLLEKLITREENGWLNLLDTCMVAGLGGDPYRSGTYEYYISEPKRVNDLKGIGAFILAAGEIDLI